MAKKTKKTKAQASVDPLDAVKRLTATELLKLAKISAEMRLESASARIVLFEGQALRARAENELKKKEEDINVWLTAELKRKEEERSAHTEESKRLQAEYKLLTAELSKKYGIDDPNSMTVDPDTGVIRDSRNL